MQRWALIVGLVALVLTGPGAVLAQGDPPAEGVPCTTADLAPVSRIVAGMVETMDREGAFGVDNLLRWRGEIAALDVPACDGMVDTVLQLQLAADELLIGALLLERAATPALVSDPATAQETTDTAALALNIGLTNLVGMRFTMAAAAQEEGSILPFGDLTGAAVIAAFEAADLPLADVILAAGPAGDSAPATETERVTFSLPSVFDGGVGQVLVFADERARDAWLGYLFGEVTDPGYVYIHQNVILQLTPELDRTTALEFRAALRTLE